MNQSFKSGFEKKASFQNALGYALGKTKFLKDKATSSISKFVNTTRENAKRSFNTGFSAGNRQSNGVKSVFNGNTTAEQKENIKKLNDKINNRAARASQKPPSMPPKMDGQQYNQMKKTNPNGIKNYNDVAKEKKGNKLLHLAVGAGTGGAAAVGAHHLINKMSDQPAAR